MKLYNIIEYEKWLKGKLISQSDLLIEDHPYMLELLIIPFRPINENIYQEFLSETRKAKIKSIINDL